MIAVPAPFALEVGTALLDRAIAYTRGTLALVTPEAFSRPTPCAAWDLGDLLQHMNDSMAALHEAVVDQRVALQPVPGESPVPTVALLQRRACDVLGAWSGLHHDAVVVVGGQPLPSSVVALTGSLEVAVHGWDVGRACGAWRPLPESLAADLLGALPLLVDEAHDRGTRFADPVPVSPFAGPGARLLAALGRDPGPG
jgi:uncharacterized protein (TIGR03086 family)